MDKLPNELLHAIVEYVGHQPGISRRYRLVSVLSRINRRLRNFALPLLLAEIRALAVPKGLTRAIQSLRPKHYNEFVRCVRVGAQLYPLFNNVLAHGVFEDVLDTSDVAGAFPSLRQFESLEICCNSKSIKALATSPCITALSLAWNDCHYPFIGAFPALETLRVHLLSAVLPSHFLGRPEQIMSFNSLTTLVLHGANYLFDAATGAAHPNLRVLSLQNTKINSRVIFDFVSRHPSLREVNVSYHKDVLTPLLGALIRLMEGTGIWADPAYGDEDDPGLDVPDDLPEEEWLQPALGISLSAFAFTRILLDRPRPRPDDGRPPALFECSGLALSTVYDMDQELGPLDDGDLPNIICLAAIVPCLNAETLSIVATTADADCHSFQDFMMTCSEACLNSWSNLRALTMSWDTPTRWTWRIQDETMAAAATQMPFLDCVRPPVDMVTGQSLTLANARRALSRELHAWSELRDEVLTLLRLSDDVEDEDVMLMPAWELHNEAELIYIVRLMAEECPLLEDFQWYSVGGECPGRGPLWKWRVHRTSDGEVSQVLGNLTWNGCPQGDPPPFQTLVGQELAHFQAAHRGTPI